jgi:hypothetical protein
MNNNMVPTREQIEAAKQAINQGRTRGQFLREAFPCSVTYSDKEVLQQWSDAYSFAMDELEQDVYGTVYRARTYLLRTLDPMSRDYLGGKDWKSRLEASDLLLEVMRKSYQGQ